MDPADLRIDLRESTGLEGLARVHYNLPAAQLVEEAVRRGEGQLTSSGALTAFTGARTGRSPRDKFLVDDPAIHDQIWWGKVNQPFPGDRFDRLRERIAAFLHGREVFVFDGSAGADPAYRIPVRVVSQHAWPSLFARQLFRRDLAESSARRFIILHVPDFLADPARDGTRSEAFILVDLIGRLILIGGTQYAGEVKKAIFGVMNYLLPEQGVFPMHCSANEGPAGDTALFFGLSGTGKTTLSADPARRLIGDDEHGWSATGVFNLEGGCYAKCIRLSEQGEPQIWNAIRFGAVLENVRLRPGTREPDYNDDSVTENTRSAFPIDFIPNAIPAGVGGHPRNIVFLSYDAFGVLPPLARLTTEQAMYHFLSGYTSKTAGTEGEKGGEPRPEFSACFAQPFLPRPPRVYASMLGERLREHGAACWLVNTGYTGGPFGVGRRLDLKISRALVDAALNGTLEDASFELDPIFGVMTPRACPGVPSDVLTPRKTWADRIEYDRAARRLATEFHRNFAQFHPTDAAIAEKGAPPAGALANAPKELKP